MTGMDGSIPPRVLFFVTHARAHTRVHITDVFDKKALIVGNIPVYTRHTRSLNFRFTHVELPIRLSGGIHQLESVAARRSLALL